MEQIQQIQQILPPTEIFTRDEADAQYKKLSMPWSLAYDKKPKTVLAPSTEESLQKILPILYNSNLDFAIRGSGIGSSSASDCILSTAAFNHFKFDHQAETVEIGTGLNWGEVDVHLAREAPGYVVVGARCPFVGVGGAVIAGGFSWISQELGVSSDPHNLLDARMVKYDGTALWTSQEPDLLWALRGGGGNFGVVTSLRMKAYKYPQEIFSGLVKVPSSAIKEFSKRVSEWSTQTSDPKTAMHVFISGGEGFLYGKVDEPQLVVLPFDANGETHARSADGFKWLLELEGVEERTGVMPLSGVNEAQRSSEGLHGKAKSWLAAPLVSDVDPDFVIRARDWYVDVVRQHSDLAHGAFVLLEVMQEAAFSSSPSLKSTAWPHGHRGRQHVLQLGLGAAASTERTNGDLESEACGLLLKAPALIGGEATHPPSDYLPNFLLPNNDFAAVFGDNWEKLKAIKASADPLNRFNTSTIRIPA